MKIAKLKIENSQRGFTLFIAIIITATLLLVATGLASISVKENFLTFSSRESQYAFYAADTGIECALYWDVKNPTGSSAFSPLTSSTISCNQDQPTVGGSSNGVSKFTIYFNPDPYCAIVKVTKNADNTTKIESSGYNTCDISNPLRVERVVEVNY